MNNLQKLSKYIVFGIIILTIDLTWLYLYMIKKYNQLFKSINLKIKNNILPAIIAYLLLIIAYPLIIESDNNNTTLQRAFIFGILSYGIYGFTLATILPKYNLRFAITETLWGGTLYVLSTLILSNIIKFI